MLIRLTLTAAAAALLASASAQGAAKLTDPQIAHVAYTAGQIDIAAAQQALKISKDPQVGGEKSGFFPIPKGDKQHAQLGGQGISVVKYSDKKDMALEYMKWFAQPQI